MQMERSKVRVGQRSEYKLMRTSNGFFTVVFFTLNGFVRNIVYV